LELVKLGSIYFLRNKCEKLHIDEPYRCKTVMNLSCNILIHIAYLINPIMPKYSKSILDSFNIEEVNVNNYLVFISYRKIKKAKILFEII
jgi:methionyl-tRNA synthetase